MTFLKIKRIVVVVVACSVMFVLSGCGDSYMKKEETRKETCVYYIERNFWGSELKKEIVACQPK